MLSNQEHSRDFDQFLGCVGETVKLNQFSRFAGGLDTKFSLVSVFASLCF
jgi:hypothetical protein